MRCKICKAQTLQVLQTNPLKEKTTDELGEATFLCQFGRLSGSQILSNPPEELPGSDSDSSPPRLAHAHSFLEILEFLSSQH